MTIQIQNPVCINGEITDKEFYERFILRYDEVLNSTPKETHIFVCINSVGGDTHTSLGIYDLISRCPKHTIGLVTGRAESGASLILQACRQRFVTTRSSILIHRSTVSVRGAVEDLRIHMKRFEEMDLQFYRIYAQRMKMSVEEIAEMARCDVLFGAEDAVSAGLADQVV